MASKREHRPPPSTVPTRPGPLVLAPLRDLVRQAALAYPGLAGQQEEPPPSSGSVFKPDQHLGHLLVPPHENRGGAAAMTQVATALGVHRPKRSHHSLMVLVSPLGLGASDGEVGFPLGVPTELSLDRHDAPIAVKPLFGPPFPCRS
jgi:hypothetical protein